MLTTALQIPAQETQGAPSQAQAEQKKKPKKLTKEEREQQAAALLKAREEARRALENLMPLVSVEESNPWTGDGGSILALYADGTLIYWLPHERGGQYRIAQLSDAETSEFFKRVDTDALPLMDLKSYAPPFLRQSYPIALDAATCTIHVRRPDRTQRYLSFFGSLHGAARGTTKGQSPEIISVLNFLASYEHPNATEWVPENVEITLWPAMKTEQPTIAWPVELPGLAAAQFNKEDGSYTLLLTREQYAQLRPILDAKIGQNFRIGEKLWRVYVYFPFPHMMSFSRRQSADNER
jgi:hypothetical protein